MAGGDRGEKRLKRTRGPLSLVSLGIGAIIGAGLFSLTGIAAAENAVTWNKDFTQEKKAN